MYKVGINGSVKEVEAVGMTIESGTIIFFEDDKNETSRMIVASGKWDYLEVDGESPALSIRPRTPAPIAEEPAKDEHAQAMEEAAKAYVVSEDNPKA